MIVFMGVGLAITDGRGHGIRGLNQKVTAASPDHTEMQQKYSQGEWFSGAGGQRFPAFTSDEQSHGQILFPGESVLYELTVSASDLPYLDIRVEGSISRRHLSHTSRPMAALRERHLVLVADAFHALDKIGLYSPLLSLAAALPELGPDTTLSVVETYKGKIEGAIAHMGKVTPELNEVFRSAPNEEIRDLIQKHIREYLTTALSICDRVLETLASGDMGRMRDSTEELETHLLSLDRVKRATANVKSQFGL